MIQHLLTDAQKQVVEDARAFVRDTPRQLILDKAEGNPFFLEEVLRSLIDAGQVLIEGSHATVTGHIDQLDMPDTLQGVVAARIDRQSVRRDELA